MQDLLKNAISNLEQEKQEKILEQLVLSLRQHYNLLTTECLDTMAFTSFERSMSEEKILLNISEMYYFSRNACLKFVDRDTTYNILINIIYQLKDIFNLSRDTIRSYFSIYGFIVSDVCYVCRDTLPIYIGLQHKKCEDCMLEADSVS